MTTHFAKKAIKKKLEAGTQLPRSSEDSLEEGPQALEVSPTSYIALCQLGERGQDHEEWEYEATG